MVTEYETFLRDLDMVLSGKESVLTLRDLTPGRYKYRGINVKAIVSKPPRPGEPLLWLRSVVGCKDPDPCSVRILEELPETLEGRPYSDYFSALDRAQG